MYFHWQNLNSKGFVNGREIVGSAIKEGRCWWVFGKNHNPTVQFSWSFFSKFLHLQMALGGGDGRAIQLSIGLYFVALWLTLEHRKLHRWLTEKTKHKKASYGNGREIGVSIHNNTVWFSLWKDAMGDWSRDDPKWWAFNFNYADFLLGRSEYSTRELLTEEALIPLPEGNYPAKVKLELATWKRKRWPWPHKIIRAEVTPRTPVPTPGKGENSWDCGQDATHSLTTSAKTVAEAVSKFVASVLRDRERYGGKNWVPEKVEK